MIPPPHLKSRPVSEISLAATRVKVKSRRRGNKYNAKRCYSEFVGRHFDSKAERQRGESLFRKAQLTADETKDYEAGIGQLEFQPKVHLTDADILYKPDFYYWDYDRGTYVWEDVKGPETDVFKLKKRLWASYGPGLLILTDGAGKVLEEIKGKGA